jgi:hypothetical protein
MELTAVLPEHRRCESEQAKLDHRQQLALARSCFA